MGFVAADFDPEPALDPAHNESCSDRDKRAAWCDTCRYRSWSSKWEKPDGEEEDGPDDAGPGRKVQRVGRRLVGSVVYPLTSYSGMTVGFQTRSIREKAFDTFMLKRRPEGAFFGAAGNIHRIWSTGEVVLVEGPSDMLVVERLVHPNVLSITTASPNVPQTRFLYRFAKRVYLCLDLDKTGRDSTASFVSKHAYKPGFDLRDVDYKYSAHQAKDPNDLWRKLGDDRFSRHMKKAIGKPA
jgi:DNA primase